MLHAVQRNFLFIWICVLLGIAIVLSLSLAGCSDMVETEEGDGQTKLSIPVEGKATSVLCQDSDSGVIKDVKGTVTREGTRRMDKCFGPFLVEYYCSDNQIQNQNFRCECSEGKCI